METIERPVAATETGQKSRRMLVALVAVVALLMGGLAGWLIGSSGDDSSGTIEVVTGELTDRQQQMLDAVEELDTAHQAGTADAALVDRLFAPQGIYTIGSSLEYRVEDGSLAEFFEKGSDRSAALYAPALVSDDTVVRLGDYGGAYSQTFKFTPSGEVLIIRAHIAN